jgi:hypothetical protein
VRNVVDDGVEFLRGVGADLHADIFPIITGEDFQKGRVKTLRVLGVRRRFRVTLQEWPSNSDRGRGPALGERAA